MSIDEHGNGKKEMPRQTLVQIMLQLARQGCLGGRIPCSAGRKSFPNVANNWPHLFGISVGRLQTVLISCLTIVALLSAGRSTANTAATQDVLNPDGRRNGRAIVVLTLSTDYNDNQTAATALMCPFYIFPVAPAQQQQSYATVRQSSTCNCRLCWPNTTPLPLVVVLPSTSTSRLRFRPPVGFYCA